MKLDQTTIGFAMTGSFCTFSEVIPQLRALAKTGAKLLPILSQAAYNTDTRFGTAAHFRGLLEEITGNPVIATIQDAEPIGPQGLLDILIVAPCTGNTLGKLANGITDTTVTMAAKAHLRNGRPLLLAVATNDALGASAVNIGRLLNAKHLYFVPMRQDDPMNKPMSMTADLGFLEEAIYAAMSGTQMQPVYI